MLRRVGTMKPKMLLLKEEKDSFDAMREIQRSTSHFKRYSALSMSVIACECIHLVMSSFRWISANLVQLAFFGALAPSVSGKQKPILKD